jgi:hypothetical protein
MYLKMSHDNQADKRSEYVWILDIYDELYEIIQHYASIDPRLEWISMADIIYGRSSYYIIKHDQSINEFISVLLNEIVKIFRRIKRIKRRENDQVEFDRLFSLNKKAIYSRIAYCLGKWC